MFPLVIYNFTFNITERQNESQVISLSNPMHRQRLHPDVQ